MKRILSLSVLVLPILLVYWQADAKQNKTTGYETATITSVEKHVSPSNYLGDSPSDAPLQAEEYSYDVGLRLNCNLYVGRYESAIDYLPAAFAPNHTVDVRWDKHVIYVSLPEHDREIKLGIVGHKRIKEPACPVNG